MCIRTGIPGGQVEAHEEKKGLFYIAIEFKFTDLTNKSKTDLRKDLQECSLYNIVTRATKHNYFS